MKATVACKSLMSRVHENTSTLLFSVFNLLFDEEQKVSVQLMISVSKDTHNHDNMPVAFFLFRQSFSLLWMTTRSL